MEPSPQVTVIILNWNAQFYLEACLRSVLAQQGVHFQVWLVDNHSRDDSVALVQTHFPQVQIWPLQENLGFSGGNNAVLRQVQTPLVVLLNPDVVVETDWLVHLVQPLLTDETIGVVGAKLFYADGHLQHVGGVIHEPQGMAGHIGHGQKDNGQYEAMTDVTYVIGASLALRRSLLDTIGYLDEGYFLYYEDADWCTRVRRAGWRVVAAPQARLLHWESVLTGKDTFRYWRNFHRGRIRYVLKHFSPHRMIGPFFLAETHWLTERTQTERHAAADAYQYALTHLTHINQDRARDGADGFTTVELTHLNEGFRVLYHQAWQTAAFTQAKVIIEQQKQLAEVRPRPFTSNFPLIGPLIRLWRTAWNQIETIAYVHPLRQQQNEVNHLITDLTTHTLEVLTRLAQPDWAQTENLLQLRQEVQSLRQQLQKANEKLDQLAQKVKTP